MTATRRQNIDKGQTLQELAEGGPCEPMEFHRKLRARLGMTHIQATNHVAAMVRAGLIKRQVVLTPEGLAKLKRLRPEWRREQ